MLPVIPRMMGGCVQRTGECHKTGEELGTKIAAFLQFEMSLKWKTCLVIDVYVWYDRFSF